jgi:2-polyprenyl-6-methoxyphenol hydroxylase-like FAD-dependent oxidoreductase
MLGVEYNTKAKEKHMLKQTDKANRKAIVIGASMAGLLAARALADHFERVTLLERDTFPPLGENRKGVPQGKHTHVLLERGRDTMEEFLPGLTADLTHHNAVEYAARMARLVRLFGRRIVRPLP